MSATDYYASKCTPTVYPAENFNALEDAKALNAAMKGFGKTDQETIIHILANRGIAQRLDIAAAFKAEFGRDLLHNLKSELTGHFEDVMVAMMTPLPEFYAKELHEAVACIGTDEGAIIEILATISNHGIRIIAQTYEKMYGKSLESALKGDTSGPFKRLLVLLLQANREENQVVDGKAATAEAIALLKVSEGQWSAEGSLINTILVHRSYPQLRQIILEYERIAKHDIEKAIKREFSGSVAHEYLAIVKCAKSKVEFFAERLHKSMVGLGTRNKALIRVVVGRSEIDLGDIKAAFFDKYKKTLESWIKDDTSGDYKKVLITLVSQDSR